MGTSEEMTKEERIEYWEMVLEDFNQSGLLDGFSIHVSQ